ncbi:unnamed protein product [Hymenolepis diminuta]|uniref:Uncharacterized protein n=1 Tax=Hymenolepis diminuta TaxID=6216 RepID=A0A564YHA1_HYMDI|nr:unnamed protein product [Hymenolepis diminuta]
MASSCNLQLYLCQMQNELQKVSNEGSQFSDIFEKIQADKAQLSTESKRLNSDTHDTLSKLSMQMNNETERQEALVECFRLVKRWHVYLLQLIYYMSYTPYESEEESFHLRQLGDSLLNSVSEVNNLEFIDPSDRYVVLKGAKWGNHIIGSSEQEASNSMVTAYNKQQGDHPPSSSNTDQHTRKVQRPWNSRQGNNNSRGRPLQRGFKRRENKNQS